MTSKSCLFVPHKNVMVLFKVQNLDSNINKHKLQHELNSIKSELNAF